MVEIIVVSLIVLGVMTSSLYIFSSASGESQNENIEQRFYELRAKLLKNLKKDVRSSTIITEESKRSWRLEVLTWDNKDIFKTKLIKYRINNKKTIVYRECEEQNNEYNFTDILEGKKLVFKINP